jgi:hypothetical protein
VNTQCEEDETLPRLRFGEFRQNRRLRHMHRRRRHFILASQARLSARLDPKLIKTVALTGSLDYEAIIQRLHTRILFEGVQIVW